MLKFLKILFVLLLLNINSYSQISTKEVIRLLDKYNIQHRDKVLRVIILETGWYKSNKAINHKNLFGFETGKCKFSSYDESVKAYKTRVESRLKEGENYYSFLKRIKYASDRRYIKKLKNINMKFRVTKISDDVFDGLHPNGINEGYTKVGFSNYYPKVGEPFMLLTPSTYFITSDVTKVMTGLFHTKNSKYKHEVLDEKE